MKRISFRRGEAIQPGVLLDGHVADLAAAAASLLEVIAGAHDRRWMDQALGKAPRLSIVSAQLVAPKPLPRRNIFCVGKNYVAHAREFQRSGFDATSSGQDVPTAPVVFTKAPSSVIGPDAAILADLDPTNSIDYEGELGVVIGRGGRSISRADAMDHVFGYTIINDVTARTLQHNHKQWFLGKSIDSFCPMGPTLVTADEIPDPTRLKLETRVNGELRQNAVVSDLIFDIPTLIETISRGITLMPGDIIANRHARGSGHRLYSAQISQERRHCRCHDRSDRHAHKSGALTRQR
jgi:2-keto-4-pentenoate hydratase/2-oxohepta-3-ene-1,7-dioic acid hydratase in catechol pathway